MHFVYQFISNLHNFDIFQNDTALLKMQHLNATIEISTCKNFKCMKITLYAIQYIIIRSQYAHYCSKQFKLVLLSIKCT